VSILTDRKNCFYRWELALLLGLGLALLLGTRLSGTQAALAEKVVRLHVVGASDSAEDQAAKLRARDAVLEEAGAWLAEAEDREEALALLSGHLEELARAGAEAAGTAVSAQLEETWFPTKRYTDFALPAGRYTALRLTLGEGEGRNWWCVVFPPLCLGSVSEEVAQRSGGFTDGQVRLISGEEEGYIVRFKLLELWDQWTRSMG